MILFMFVFFQAEDGIRDLVRSRGLGDVYKRQTNNWPPVVVKEEGTVAPLNWPKEGAPLLSPS